MSKKKGLSLEEKRSRMLEIFFETKDVFQLKDIEKIAPKTKGITPMSVKEVLQSLVDDNMVDCERVGTSNYYWAFPSKALHARKHKLEELQKQISEAKQQKKSLQNAAEKAKVGRQDTKERSSLLKELRALREQRTQQQAELEKYRECDPEVVEEINQMWSQKTLFPGGQTIFLLSSHGQRRSLPLMTAALIKPLGSLRTLTTWTESHHSSQ
ncbi:hypothetical protein PAMA_016588 [Pampus argenteus]